MAWLAVASISASAEQTCGQKTLRATKTLNTSVYFIVFLLALNIYIDHYGLSMVAICNGGPVPTSLVLPSSSSMDSPTIRVVNLTRQHGGDTFTAFGRFAFWTTLCLFISIICGAIFNAFFIFKCVIFNEFSKMQLVRLIQMMQQSRILFIISFLREKHKSVRYFDSSILMMLLLLLLLV